MIHSPFYRYPPGLSLSRLIFWTVEISYSRAMYLCNIVKVSASESLIRSNEKPRLVQRINPSSPTTSKCIRYPTTILTQNASCHRKITGYIKRWLSISRSSSGTQYRPRRSTPLSSRSGLESTADHAPRRRLLRLTGSTISCLSAVPSCCTQQPSCELPISTSLLQHL
jgi:hypothetical protein